MGSEFRAARNARQLGGLMASGDVAGARNAAYGQGDLRTGQAFDGQARDAAERQRGTDITAALRGGEYDQAASFAQSPEELAQVSQFRDSATEQERTEAASRAGQMAAVVGSIQSLPADQQYAAAQQAAQHMGMDPASITPDMVTPEALERLRVQSMGLAAYLQFQDREADNRRQQATFDETVRHNRATEGVASARVGVSQAREGRVAAGRGSGGSRPRSGGGAAPAPAARPWEAYR